MTKRILIRGFVKFFEMGNNIVPITSNIIALNRYKYDKINKDFHNKVIRGYKKISKNNKRFYKIDATKSITSISEQIIEEIIKLND